ncbi:MULTISPECIES: hypothetical protein [Colwellia]|uniref:Uncharacterized protein n=1 Tax=Colwellia marinimaniae TaxID=1513592 RepID=A0ABQ0MUY3_9GAMM|nr:MULTISPECIES: hypothetical protein [Colwellia]GAW96170.1 hypothetical protein MTCD1_01780 [Colwellia marinimaniae]
MINKVLNSPFDLKTSLALAVNEQSYTLTDELKDIAPEMVPELFSQFDQERVAQLLHQQFTALIMVSSSSTVLGYQYSDTELAYAP